VSKALYYNCSIIFERIVNLSNIGAPMKRKQQ